MTKERFPLLFTYLDRISGNGFLAEIVTQGRALAVTDLDAKGIRSYWMFGVNPGGLAEGSTEHPSVATANFRRSFTTVLIDLAEEAGTFADFKRSVEEFFHETNDPRAEEWKLAVEAVRAGKVSAEGVRKKKAETPPTIEIAEVCDVSKLSASQNRIEREPAIAA